MTKKKPKWQIKEEEKQNRSRDEARKLLIRGRRLRGDQAGANALEARWAFETLRDYNEANRQR
jgi:hypothetical protein